MPTFDRLPGVGRVRVYDAGPRIADRYTVLFEDAGDPDRYDWAAQDGLRAPHHSRPYGPRHALGLSSDPDWPLGVSQYDAVPPGPHLGRRIPFAALPENVQRHVIARATED